MSPVASPLSAIDASESIFEQIQNDDYARVLVGVTRLRTRLVSSQLHEGKYDDDDKHFSAQVTPAIIERLVHVLQSDKATSVLQFEVAWTLSTLAVGTSDATRLVDAGVIPVASHLLQHTTIQDIRIKLICLLANIAGDSPTNHDRVHDSPALGHVLAIGNALRDPDAERDLFRHVAWFLSNIFRDKHHSQMSNDDVVEPSIAILARMLILDDVETRRDACWALTYLSDDVGVLESMSKHPGLLERIVHLAAGTDEDDVIPALRVAGNMACGDDTQCQRIINAGILRVVGHILTSSVVAAAAAATAAAATAAASLSSDVTMETETSSVSSTSHFKHVRRDALWVLSCIAYGMPEHVESIIAADLFPKVVRAVREAESFHAKQNAVCVLMHAIRRGTDQQVRYIVGQDALPCLCANLIAPDADDSLDALLAIERVLYVGVADGSYTNNMYAEMVETHGGIDNMEALINHENEIISTTAQKILDTFFVLGEEEEEEEKDLNVCPPVATPVKSIPSDANMNA